MKVLNAHQKKYKKMHFTQFHWSKNNLIESLRDSWMDNKTSYISYGHPRMFPYESVKINPYMRVLIVHMEKMFWHTDEIVF